MPTHLNQFSAIRLGAQHQMPPVRPRPPTGNRPAPRRFTVQRGTIWPAERPSTSRAERRQILPLMKQIVMMILPKTELAFTAR
jgi:hypothetical protein